MISIPKQQFNKRNNDFGTITCGVVEVFFSFQVFVQFFCIEEKYIFIIVHEGRDTCINLQKQVSIVHP